MGRVAVYGARFRVSVRQTSLQQSRFRIEIVCAIWQRQDVFYQLLIVLVISDEVNLRAINYQQFGIRIVVKKLRVGPVQLVQICLLYTSPSPRD